MFFWKILEIVRHHKPECIILENVKNLTTHDDGKTFTPLKI
jgi:DNA (cytosine-5)-methyltransferase 1